MPFVGLGTCCGISNSIVYQMVKDAIDVGYRHIDTAFVYGNEIEVGQAINEKITAGVLKREDIFITTKVWNTYHSRGRATEAIRLALKKLNVTYIDLMLIHWPMGYSESTDDFPKDSSGNAVASNVDYLDTWKALEDSVNDKLVRSIGLSNFNHLQIDRVLENSKIKPTVLQVESHPFLTQKSLIEYSKQHNITVTAYAPLGNGALIDVENVTKIAEKHNVSAAQVLLRYQVQRGVIVIPRSTHKERIIENISLFGFQLTDEDIKTLDGLNKGVRYYAEDFARNHIYYPFNVPY